MKITQADGRMVIADTPGCLWLFGLMFVLSGSSAMIAAFAVAAPPTFVFLTRSAAFVIGAAHLSAGLWIVRRHASTLTELDRESGQGRHLVRRPGSRTPAVTAFALADVRAVDIRHDRDSEGDPMFQVRLWLSGSRLLPLQAQPAQGERAALQHADAIRQFLNL